MSGLIGAKNNFGAYFNNPDAEMEGNITALYDIGCVIGAIVCYFVGESLGRRTMLINGGSIMIVGTAILASSTTVAQLIVGRIVTGIGNGMNSSTAPVYLTECAPASYRGALLTLQGTVTILGVVIAYWLDYGTSFSDSTLQWRLPLAFQGVFAVLLVLQIIGLPETPRWLVQHDRSEEAHQVVADIEDIALDDERVVQTIQDIKAVITEEQKGGPFRFKELFSVDETQNFRRLLITISVQLCQQFSGSNFLNYYLPTILQSQLRLDRNMSLILGGAAQCTFLVGSAIPVLLMDRFGRRVLLMVCSAGLSMCFIIVAILLSTGDPGPAKGATAFIFLFQLFYGIGWLPVPWFYPSEINTTRTRSKMQAIGCAWNWMAVFAVVKITPIAIQNISWRIFIVFGVLNFAFIPLVFCFYPETKGIELEDIPFLFPKKSITGGVFTSRGKTVVPQQHRRQDLAHAREKNDLAMIEG
jgi:sugar porter (SP) family MFS transporter